MTDYTTSTSASPKAGLRLKHLLLIALLTFLGGAGAAAWFAYHYGYVGTTPVAPAPAVPTAPSPVGNVQAVLPPAAPPSGAEVGALEDRMDAINDDAAAASGNAARAEGLLIAFAARRALDGGQPLGYVAGQLQQRFGSSQPQAVASILSAAQSPVTKDALHAELQGLKAALTTGNPRAGGWDRFKRELSELFVLRKDGTPPSAPSQQIQRALAAVDAGNMKAAIAEVQSMPGAAAASGWLGRARQYVEARRALDTIERAAIQSTSAAPVAAVQTSPQTGEETGPQTGPVQTQAVTGSGTAPVAATSPQRANPTP